MVKSSSKERSARDKEAAAAQIDQGRQQHIPTARTLRTAVLGQASRSNGSTLQAVWLYARDGTCHCLGEMQCEVVVGSYEGDIKGFRFDLLQPDRVCFVQLVLTSSHHAPQSLSPLVHLIIIIIHFPSIISVIIAIYNYQGSFLISFLRSS